MGPGPLGNLQHQIRAYASRFTRGDGKPVAAQLCLGVPWMRLVHLLVAHQLGSIWM
jgi:hypothetical protein